MNKTLKNMYQVKDVIENGPVIMLRLPCRNSNVIDILIENLEKSWQDGSNK
jgi:hypothetical protein